MLLTFCFQQILYLEQTTERNDMNENDMVNHTFNNSVINVEFIYRIIDILLGLQDFSRVLKLIK